jgi:hypothetical protein
MLDKVTGVLDQRLVLTSLLPAIAFWAAVAGLAGAQAGWPRVGARWNGFDSTAKILLTVAAVAFLVLFALLLSAAEGALLSLYEGYWGNRGPGGWLAGARKSRHKRRRAGRDGDYEFIYLNYPRDRNKNTAAGADQHPEYIMPTRLGNIIKAAELYPGDVGRYGMDAVFFWPRLYQVIPDSVRSGLVDARTSLALMLNVCTLALGLAAGSLIALAAAIRPAGACWAAAASGLVIAWLSYRSALGAARVYGELVRSMYDLYRGDLLDRLGFTRPETLAEERVLWWNLGQQMYRRVADTPAVLDAARVKVPGSGQ